MVNVRLSKLTTPNGDPISSYCFGTMQFGGNADKVASQGMFDACIAAGINFFDTAYVYTDGRSEQLLGEMVTGKSDRFFIATNSPQLEAPAGKLFFLNSIKAESA